MDKCVIRPSWHLQRVAPNMVSNQYIDSWVTRRFVILAVVHLHLQGDAPNMVSDQYIDSWVTVDGEGHPIGTVQDGEWRGPSGNGAQSKRDGRMSRFMKGDRGYKGQRGGDLSHS